MLTFLNYDVFMSVKIVSSKANQLMRHFIMVLIVFQSNCFPVRRMYTNKTKVIRYNLP